MGKQGVIKKYGMAITPDDVHRYLNQLSKAALIELAYDLAVVGNGPENARAVLVRHVGVVCYHRNDRRPKHTMLDRPAAGTDQES